MAVFFWCFVVTFLFWWCENSSFFVFPKPADPCFSEILSTHTVDTFVWHQQQYGLWRLSIKCERQHQSQHKHTTMPTQYDYSMCPSVICLYALMAFFLKSDLKIVMVLRHRWRDWRIHWPFSFYFWDMVILFDPPIEMLYSTL